MKVLLVASAVWLVLFSLPVLTLWSIGIPITGEIFWFSKKLIVGVIIWFWFTFWSVFAVFLRNT